MASALFCYQLSIRSHPLLSASAPRVSINLRKRVYSPRLFPANYSCELCIFGRCMIVIKSLDVSHGAISPPTHVVTWVLIGCRCQIVNPRTSPRLVVSAGCSLTPHLTLQQRESSGVREYSIKDACHNIIG